MLNMHELPLPDYNNIIVPENTDLNTVCEIYEEVETKLRNALMHNAVVKRLSPSEKRQYIDPYIRCFNEKRDAVIDLFQSKSSSTSSSSSTDNKRSRESNDDINQANNKKHRAEQKDSNTSKVEEAKQILETYQGLREAVLKVGQDVGDFNCTIKCGFIVNPVETPCEHYFEKEAIVDYIRSTPKCEVKCPNCHTEGVVLREEKLKPPNRMYRNQYAAYVQGMRENYNKLRDELAVHNIHLEEFKREEEVESKAAVSSSSTSASVSDRPENPYNDAALNDILSDTNLEASRRLQETYDADREIDNVSSDNNVSDDEEPEYKPNPAIFNVAGWWEQAERKDIQYYLTQNANALSHKGFLISSSKFTNFNLKAARYLCAMIWMTQGGEDRLSQLERPINSLEKKAILDMLVYNVDVHGPGNRYLYDFLPRLFQYDWDINEIIIKAKKNGSDYNLASCLLAQLSGNRTNLKSIAQKTWETLIAAGLDLTQTFKYRGGTCNIRQIKHKGAWVKEVLAEVFKKVENGQLFRLSASARQTILDSQPDAVSPPDAAPIVAVESISLVDDLKSVGQAANTLVHLAEENVNQLSRLVSSSSNQQVDIARMSLFSSLSSSSSSQNSNSSSTDMLAPSSFRSSSNHRAMVHRVSLFNSSSSSSLASFPNSRSSSSNTTNSLRALSSNTSGDIYSSSANGSLFPSHFFEHGYNYNELPNSGLNTPPESSSQGSEAPSTPKSSQG